MTDLTDLSPCQNCGESLSDALPSGACRHCGCLAHLTGCHSLRMLMNRGGLGVNVSARAMGVSRSTMRGWLSGKKEPSPRRLEMLALYLETMK